MCGVGQNYLIQPILYSIYNWKQKAGILQNKSTKNFKMLFLVGECKKWIYTVRVFFFKLKKQKRGQLNCKRVWLLFEMAPCYQVTDRGGRMLNNLRMECFQLNKCFIFFIKMYCTKSIQRPT